MPYKSIGNSNHTRRTAVTVQERVVGATDVCQGEGPNSLRVRMLEAVKRLIIVAHDAERRARAKQIHNSLLCLVEILVFIDQNVVIECTLRSRRIIA